VPVIFVNKKYWYGLYTWLRDTALKDRMISKADLGLISFADTTEEILKIIEKKG
jgi:predicted Rossmann-fold nucleotide-binding protein